MPPRNNKRQLTNTTTTGDSNTSICYLGIDPGKNGGMAVILGDSTQGEGIEVRVVSCSKLDMGGIWKWIKQFSPLNGYTTYVVMEKVTGYVGRYGGKDGSGDTGSSMFTFGTSYGALQMALVVAEIPGDNIEEVMSQHWQRRLGISPREFLWDQGKGKRRKKIYTETRAQFKGRLKMTAQSLFPGVKLTLATSDALLLAELARRKHS